MTNEPAPTKGRLRAGEAIAGILAAASLFIGFLEFLYRPFRLAPIALILILIATVMSRDQQRLIALALTVVGVGFVAGAALQVVTHHPLF